jgi:hypothetical protein
MRPSLELEELAAELGCLPPCYIPTIPVEGANRDKCVVNVKTAVDRWGGTVRFGWKLSEATGLWVTARFHAVRETGGGLLVDETPHEHLKVGSYGLFALDAYASAQFKDHPSNVRRSIYRPLVPTERRSTSVDPLSSAVDNVVEALNALDALFEPTDEGRRCVDPNRLSERYSRVQRAHRRLLRLLDDRPRRETPIWTADPRLG